MKTNKKRIIYPKLSYKVMKICFDVQNELGTKYQEKHYQRALKIKFDKHNVSCEEQSKVDVTYEGKRLGRFYADFIIEDKIVLELKTVDYLHQDTARQLLRYLITLDKKLGIAINFRNSPLEYKRIVNPKFDN